MSKPNYNSSKMTSTPTRNGPFKQDGGTYRDNPATPSTKGSATKSLSPASHSTVSTVASRKRGGQPKKRSSAAKKRVTDNPNHSSRKLNMNGSNQPKPAKTDGDAQPDATHVNWLDPQYVMDLINKLDPNGVGEEDYEENLAALFAFYKPQEIGFALLKTKMLLGDNTPDVPKLRKDKEEELIQLCINHYNMKVESEEASNTDQRKVPGVIDLSNDEESR